jgi:myo-inositol-1(or 4)-monophosphatase
MNIVPGVLSGPEQEIDGRESLCMELAAGAGRLALDGFLDAKSARRSMKGRQDFLTETDGAVESFIRSRIAEQFPGDGFLGEETGGVVAPSLWVVDPIDGTANFARGIPHFCISIAFVRDGLVELGAICNPSLEELHIARRGRGAFRNGKPIRVSATRDYDQACVELGWSTRVPNDAYLDALKRVLELGVNVRRGASGALGLAYVADGRSDAYAELHMQPWDCLAGLLMVREAGGLIGSYPTGAGLERGGPVLAACPGIARGISDTLGIALAS